MSFIDKIYAQIDFDCACSFSYQWPIALNSLSAHCANKCSKRFLFVWLFLFWDCVAFQRVIRLSVCFAIELTVDNLFQRDKKMEPFNRNWQFIQIFMGFYSYQASTKLARFNENKIVILCVFQRKKNWHVCSLIENGLFIAHYLPTNQSLRRTIWIDYGSEYEAILSFLKINTLNDFYVRWSNDCMSQ